MGVSAGTPPPPAGPGATTDGGAAQKAPAHRPRSLWELGTPRQGNILGHVSWGLAGRGSPSLLSRGRLEPPLVSRWFVVSGF